jgi:hypothetical protein
MKRIPKILHLYWDLGPMSFLQALTTVSFRKHNPDWQINCYVPKQNYSGSAKYIPDYKGKDHFAMATSVSGVNVIEVDLDDYDIDHGHHNILRSDIFRYHKLYECGGVWSDFDVIWLKPVEEFANTAYFGTTAPNMISAVVSFIRGTYGGHSIGILMHSKQDPYIGSVVELTKTVTPPFQHESFGALMLSSAYPTLDSIIAKFPNTVGARFETYYPYSIHPHNKIIHRLYNGTHLPPVQSPNVICLHWYNGHVLSKAYVNNNGLQKQCTMTKLLAREGYL